MGTDSFVMKVVMLLAVNLVNIISVLKLNGVNFSGFLFAGIYF